jgi:hypothetical protein
MSFVTLGRVPDILPCNTSDLYKLPRDCSTVDIKGDVSISLEAQAAAAKLPLCVYGYCELQGVYMFVLKLHRGMQRCPFIQRILHHRTFSPRRSRLTRPIPRAGISDHGLP